MNIGRLADFLAGEPEPGYSPSLRGIAESDSSDGEVEVYLGEVEQVYQTSIQPLYEVDEDGDIVYDDEGLPVQMVDDDGQPMSAMQTVYDSDGNPVPELDSDGYPVFEKVQLLDADGDPIVEYDADGNPVAQTDQQGNPVYLEDEDGNRIPELDEAGEIIYQRDPETGETILDEDDNPVPVYQVAPVEESQVAVIETIGTVRAGETPVISMGGAASTAIAAGGWGDSIEQTFVELGDSLTVTETIANEAHSIATGTEAHFWHDASGAHVATEEGTTELGYAFTVNATSDAAGAIITYDNQVLSSWTQSALSFWDGLGLLPKHIMGFFGRLGQRVGRLASMHMSVDETGLRVANGPVALLYVGGTGNGEYEYLKYTIDGYTYQGGLTPLHVYGEGDLVEGYPGNYSLAAAVADDPDTELHVYPGEADGWVYVDVPVNAPDPDLWIISDGAIAGGLMTLEYAWRTKSVAGGAFDYAGAGKKYIDGNEEVISSDGYNNDYSEAVLYFHHYVADAETSGYNRCWFRVESTTARHYVVASAYPDLTYSARVGTNLEVSGDATVDGDLTAGGEVEDGDGNILSLKINGATGSVQVPVVANGETPAADRPTVTFPAPITGQSPAVYFAIGSSPSVWHMRDLRFGYNLIGNSSDGYTGFTVRCYNAGSNTGTPWVRWMAVWN